MSNEPDEENEEDQLDSPPSQESEFNEDEFYSLLERQYEYPERTTVRDAIGNPAIRPLADIVPDELEEVLDNLFELLQEHGVGISFLFDVDIQEQYRFITEELLNEEMDKIYIPGLMMVFTYEDFHPNDREDSQHWAGEFLRALFEKDEEMLDLCIGSDEFYDHDGVNIPKNQFIHMAHSLQAENPVVTSYSFKTVFVHVSGDYADVDIQTSWENLEKTANIFVAIHGISNFRMKRSPYGGWDVIQFQLPARKITS